MSVAPRPSLVPGNNTPTTFSVARALASHNAGHQKSTSILRKRITQFNHWVHADGLPALRNDDYIAFQCITESVNWSMENLLYYERFRKFVEEYTDFSAMRSALMPKLKRSFVNNAAHDLHGQNRGHRYHLANNVFVPGIQLLALLFPTATHLERALSEYGHSPDTSPIPAVWPWWPQAESPAADATPAEPTIAPKDASDVAAEPTIAPKDAFDVAAAAEETQEIAIDPDAHEAIEECKI